jgi:hypothetical protein
MLPKRNDSSPKWTIDSISSSGIKKARPVNNFTLDPAAGLLKGHLTTSTSSCGCYPKTQCVLYVIGPTAMEITIELLQGCGERALVHAIFCNVILCLKCFKIFHTVGNLDKLRFEVRKNKKKFSKLM